MHVTSSQMGKSLDQGPITNLDLSLRFLLSAIYVASLAPVLLPLEWMF